MQRYEDHQFRSSENQSADREWNLEDEFDHLTVKPPSLSEEARRVLEGDDFRHDMPDSSHRLPPRGPSTPMVWGLIAAATILATSLRSGDHSNPNSPTPSQPGPELSTQRKPTPPSPTPSKAKGEQSREEMKKLSYDEYAALIKGAGGKLHLDGMPSVLAIRFQTHIKPLYDDLIVVLTPDKKVTVLDGATHPSVHSLPSFMRDVNRDGKHDVGMLRPGNYMAFSNGEWLGEWSYRLKTTSGKEDLPGWRSTVREDGDFSEAEKRASERRGDTIDGILIHRGHAKGAFSVGCQTLSPENMRRFISAVGGKDANFTFTLIDRSGK